MAFALPQEPVSGAGDTLIATFCPAWQDVTNAAPEEREPTDACQQQLAVRERGAGAVTLHDPAPGAGCDATPPRKEREPTGSDASRDELAQTGMASPLASSIKGASARPVCMAWRLYSRRLPGLQ